MDSICADLVIQNVKIYNSYFKSFSDADVYIKEGKIYHIDYGKVADFKVGEVIDGEGRHMVPGLIDIHMHIESSMMTPGAFCDRLIACGVTTIVTEPHEMANVKGLQGILDMIRAGEGSKMDIFYGIPSCVPSTSGELETTGGAIGLLEMGQLKEQPAVICVGEVMNYRQIIEENQLEISKFLKKLRATDKTFPIEGHCPALVDYDLSRFLFLGINGDHTEHNLEEFRQRFAGGMFVELQEKMLTKEILDFIAANNLYEHFCFVTDDVMADTLMEHGHLDNIVRTAVSLGMKTEQALYNATFTSARRMNLLDRGALDPGKLADFVLLDELNSLKVFATYKNGICIYQKDSFVPSLDLCAGFEESYYRSIHLGYITEDALHIPVKDLDSVLVRAMVIRDKTTKTEETLVRMPVKDGFLDWEGSGCLLTVVLERYHGTGNIGFGFITGDCHKKGAVASSYAHDSHNLLVAGSCTEDILVAANRVIQLQGGIVTAFKGSIQSELELNIGGILSGGSAGEVGTALSLIRSSMKGLGYSHYNPIMSFCTITLPVSPALKLTDKGLINVKEGKIVPLYITKNSHGPIK